MIRQLRIQNFKLWKDTNDVRMAPITLFFGTNSSGKSSIGQFLMLLRQTIESADRKVVLNPGGNNTAVQLGSYQEMILHRNSKLQMKFEYSWDMADSWTITDSITKSKYLGDFLTFSAEIAKATTGDDLSVNNLNYRLSDEHGNQVMTVQMAKMPAAKKSPLKSEYQVEATPYKFVRNLGRAWNPGPPVRFYGFPDEVVAYYQNAEFVQQLNLSLEELFKSIYYLGPLRTKTERIYSWAGVAPEHVGFSGENTVSAMIAAKSKKLKLRSKKSYTTFEELIALKLLEMGLIEEMKVDQISEKRNDFEVKVKTPGSKDFVDLPDVGVGVSQVLPVLVQCFYAPANSIIILEQPEIHLHPKAQAALADVLIDVVNSRENGKPRNIQLIIETHSEHFLRRLQRRIAENCPKRQVDKNSVAAYFASTTKRPATLEPLLIDEYGNIKNWPEHFFGDEMGDALAQTQAAIERRRSKKQ